MALKLTQVDAFTDRPYAGNPAAVVVLPEPRDDRWLAQVAREMNLSETAFLLRRAEPLAFDLRWFTPAVEVDLCGHATLASAHVLWEDGHVGAGEAVRFHTRSGELGASRRGELIELDFPAKPDRQADAPRALLDALGIAPIYAGRSQYDWILEVEDPGVLRDVHPDFGRLRTVDARGVIVTSRSDSPQFDFVSRFFAPAAGVPEDPVTGSAHCLLTPYWAARLGKTRLSARQLSARGGELVCELNGDRVVLSGACAFYMEGRIELPD